MWLELLARALTCGGELPDFPIRKVSKALAISFMARRQDDMFPWHAVSTRICSCTRRATVDNDMFPFNSLLKNRQVDQDRRGFAAEMSLHLA